ncbi:MAG: flagellar hook-basal body protein [Candidatus Eiseniibacteriota bacterium]
MPIRAIVNTARTLSYYLRLQEVTSNNLANANSDGFKADRMTARELPDSAEPVPVEVVDLRQGALRDTGRPFDVALRGSGFFVVRTPEGERLTRGGSLHLDAGGRLVDVHGNPLLGNSGPIIVDGSRMEVQDDGSVLSDDALAGRLRIVDVDGPQSLLKQGSGLYVSRTPVHAVEEGATTVKQGAVEDANLETITSMVDLITIQRAYSANLEALKAMDGVLAVITNNVGKE